MIKSCQEEVVLEEVDFEVVDLVVVALEGVDFEVVDSVVEDGLEVIDREVHLLGELVLEEL